MWLLRPQERWQNIVMSTSCVFVCVCVCLSVYIPGTTRAIFTNLSVRVAYSRGSVLLRKGDEIPREGAILGVVRATHFIGNLSLHPSVPRSLQKGIIQSQIITTCSRKDHSVCQASATRNPENSERRRCGVSIVKRVMGVHRAGEVWYLRLPCCSCNLSTSPCYHPHHRYGMFPELDLYVIRYFTSLKYLPTLPAACFRYCQTMEK